MYRLHILLMSSGGIYKYNHLTVMHTVSGVTHILHNARERGSPELFRTQIADMTIRYVCRPKRSSFEIYLQYFTCAKLKYYFCHIKMFTGVFQ